MKTVIIAAIHFKKPAHNVPWYPMRHILPPTLVKGERHFFEFPWLDQVDTVFELVNHTEDGDHGAYVSRAPDDALTQSSLLRGCREPVAYSICSTPEGN